MLHGVEGVQESGRVVEAARVGRDDEGTQAIDDRLHGLPLPEELALRFGQSLPVGVDVGGECGGVQRAQERLVLGEYFPDVVESQAQLLVPRHCEHLTVVGRGHRSVGVDVPEPGGKGPPVVDVVGRAEQRGNALVEAVERAQELLDGLQHRTAVLVVRCLLRAGQRPLVQVGGVPEVGEQLLEGARGAEHCLGPLGIGHQRAGDDDAVRHVRVH